MVVPIFFSQEMNRYGIHINLSEYYSGGVYSLQLKLMMYQLNDKSLGINFLARLAIDVKAYQEWSLIPFSRNEC